ncbi:unnamed protein product [Nesidiocoris tenuis]|uniref:Uncharacterized protein n=1 Tax=Nesidiocoris tenuis TaxID=355587 RepID=A0A6H5HF64_9HEMI|nr:unnamed protein product [Nesidiocoris tenuis]
MLSLPIVSADSVAPAPVKKIKGKRLTSLEFRTGLENPNRWGYRLFRSEYRTGGGAWPAHLMHTAEWLQLDEPPCKDQSRYRLPRLGNCRGGRSARRWRAARITCQSPPAEDESLAGSLSSRRGGTTSAIGTRACHRLTTLTNSPIRKIGRQRGVFIGEKGPRIHKPWRRRPVTRKLAFEHKQSTSTVNSISSYCPPFGLTESPPRL